jgi:predicted transcriptional regulator
MSDKQIALEMIQRMPESATLDDIANRLRFLAAVQKGLNQVKGGKLISNDQVKRELTSWLSK